MLADPGYEGAGHGVHVPVKKPAGVKDLDISTRARNALLRSVRCLGERGFALLTQRWRTLQHVTASPGRIGLIAKAALVLVLFEHKMITVRTKAHDRPGIPGGMPGVEVGTVITALTVDAALQHICAIFREQADRGDITATERDLLIDGAILLAMHVDDLGQNGRVGSHSGWPEGTLPEPVGRHQRHAAAAAA